MADSRSLYHGLGFRISVRKGDLMKRVLVLSVAASLAKVWPRADVSPTSSCYCAPGGQMLSAGGDDD